MRIYIEGIINNMIFKKIFRKKISEIEERERELSKLESFLHRKLGNPLDLYEVFVDRATRCAMIIYNKEHSTEEKISMLDDRALDLLCTERFKYKLRWELLEDEVELTIIRYIVRYCKETEYFPSKIPYITEGLDLLHKRAIENLEQIKRIVYT